MNSRNEPRIDFKKIALASMAIYIIFAISFYFLAGDQLRYRKSRGNVSMLPAESGTVELVDGTVIEQRFVANIQRLESVSVQWGTYYRPNAGTAVMELWNVADGNLLLRQGFNVAEISEGGLTTLAAETPIEGLIHVPLLLRIYSDAWPGSAASPMMSLNIDYRKGFSLKINGKEKSGTLCFSASGEDYIWTGLHYWTFTAVGVAALLAFFGVVWLRKKKGHSYVINALIAVQKYKFLIRQLVNRDFKTKYKRSVLGMFWSFLNPLLTMLVQYAVFSTLFKSDIPNFPAYLLIGIVSFNFFSEACGMALLSIVGNAGLITKVYMPKYIYPLTRVMSSVVNLAISLIPMVLVCLLTGVKFKKAAVLSLFFFLCLIVFSLGMGMLLASSMVFFRDTQFLWGVVSMIWMYLTPIFYPESIIPENFLPFYRLNPLYQFLSSERMCILNGISPEPVVYVRCMLVALGMLAVGALVFRKSQDRFILYL